MLNRTTLARPYARAAFRVARDRSELSRWSESLAIAAAIASDAGARPLLSNPKLSREQVLKLFTDIAGERFDEMVTNFLRVLTTYGRLELLPEISTQFESLRREAEARLRVQVTSAHPLGDDEASRLTERLKARFGLEIDLDVDVDPALIGGAVIRAGDQVIDGSVRGRLERLGRQVAV
ncbi:MAG: F0F1 ATP synthase subunit delta [Wenzhouxiangella sp.]|nr:MAG: F0F1 ATP synthase subunit delta [Wenzhouxiangella sp.]